jgi:hypothetical protein
MSKWRTSSKFPEPQLPSASLRRPQEYSGFLYPKQVVWTTSQIMQAAVHHLWSSLLPISLTNEVSHAPKNDHDEWLLPKSTYCSLIILIDCLMVVKWCLLDMYAYLSTEYLRHDMSHNQKILSLLCCYFFHQDMT